MSAVLQWCSEQLVVERRQQCGVTQARQQPLWLGFASWLTAIKAYGKDGNSSSGLRKGRSNGIWWAELGASLLVGLLMDQQWRPRGQASWLG
ncbi:hypothetical protein ACJRO7_014731 [Eucalyptus globulus]|uniref:Uncharacterized protein n=1 Tax=Eucalyptus globulus TaxID=34317 RepID=A0ABD3L513_EUCGL